MKTILDCLLFSSVKLNGINLYSTSFIQNSMSFITGDCDGNLYASKVSTIAAGYEKKLSTNIGLDLSACRKFLAHTSPVIQTR